ncbi:hypothetical protein V6N13_004844 [Hibiscus sabdariffa]
MFWSTRANGHGEVDGIMPKEVGTGGQQESQRYMAAEESMNVEQGLAKEGLLSRISLQVRAYSAQKCKDNVPPQTTKRPDIVLTLV